MLANPKFRDALAFRGDYKLAVVDYRREGLACRDLEHRGGVCPLAIDHRVEHIDGHNTIVTSLKQSVVDQGSGQASPLNLLVTQIAVGTSSAATTAGLTQLVTEYARVALSGSPVKTSSQAFSVFWFLGTAQGNAPSSLQEWGIMAGGATGVAGSGTMIARFLQTFAKSGTNTVSGEWDFSIA
jgi:hypothetical protein